MARRPWWNPKISLANNDGLFSFYSTVAASEDVAPESIASGDPVYYYGLSQPDSSIRMHCEFNISIPKRDGVLLQADLYRPDKGAAPSILAMAPYPRRHRSQPGLVEREGVGSRYEHFEQANPDFWIPRGYPYLTDSGSIAATVARKERLPLSTGGSLFAASGLNESGKLRGAIWPMIGDTSQLWQLARLGV